MQEQFTDRLLNCVDCHGEFIFTAGEQLFFFDKQFKNDPKRCKPCKGRRSGLSAAANGAGPVSAGLARTETRTLCSDCGIETTVPFKPTQGRPVLCRQCFQLKNRAGAPVLEPRITLQPPTPPAAGVMAALGTDAGRSRTSDPAFLPGNGRTPGPLAEAALLPAASVAVACKPTSIASPADLAYIASLQQPTEPIGRTTPIGYPLPAYVQLTNQLMAGSASPDLHGKPASPGDVQAAAQDAPQA